MKCRAATRSSALFAELLLQFFYIDFAHIRPRELLYAHYLVWNIPVRHTAGYMRDYLFLFRGVYFALYKQSDRKSVV